MLQFHDINSVIRMGGFGHYVWSAVLLVFLLLIGNLFVLHSGLHRLFKRLKKQDMDISDEKSA